MYRIPSCADAPRIDVHLPEVDLTDEAGPLGSKGMAQSPINPVSPATANAIEDAIGFRFRELLFVPSLIFVGSTRLTK
jgi:putative selenate reductase molybdopterin-binding subunit